MICNPTTWCIFFLTSLTSTISVKNLNLNVCETALWPCKSTIQTNLCLKKVNCFVTAKSLFVKWRVKWSEVCLWSEEFVTAKALYWNFTPCVWDLRYFLRFCAINSVIKSFSVPVLFFGDLCCLCCWHYYKWNASHCGPSDLFQENTTVQFQVCWYTLAYKHFLFLSHFTLFISLVWYNISLVCMRLVFCLTVENCD